MGLHISWLQKALLVIGSPPPRPKWLVPVLSSDHARAEDRRSSHPLNFLHYVALCVFFSGLLSLM
uniref:Uncharacterized protein n=1 Tax=Nelumbo nucifera TaxID=4432 RepID=A0A822XI43_NELNU|nr:TPA_asm: hypothetical protein HUJ06_021513 [Nelumbo nucifera]